MYFIALGGNKMCPCVLLNFWSLTLSILFLLLFDRVVGKGLQVLEFNSLASPLKVPSLFSQTPVIALMMMSIALINLPELYLLLSSVYILL